MKSHMLKDRLLLRVPTTVPSALGDSRTEWEPYLEGRAVAAQRIKASGSGITETGEVFADYRAEYWVNSCHPVREGWQAEDTATGTAYTVRTWFPVQGERLVRICCERIND